MVAPLLISGSGVEAATSDASLPWAKGTDVLMKELTGPLPKIAGVIAVAVSGAMMAFGEMQGMQKKAMQTTFGIGIALGAPSLIEALTNAKDVAGCMF